MAQLRLTRSSSDKVITGVCGGLSAYLGIDTTIVRVGFVLLGFASGIGVPLYIILTLVLPQDTSEPDEPMSKVVKDNLDNLGDTVSSSVERARSNPDGRNTAAFILIALGIYFLLQQFGWVLGHGFWPILLIILGIGLIIRWRQG